MNLGRFLVEAVIVSGASPSELARSHPISRSWLFRLLARYKEGGYEALEPRSRRPKSCPSRTAPEIQQAIVDLRRELTDAGLDAGAQTIPTTSGFASELPPRGRPSGGSSSPMA
jgi:transposase